MKRALLLALALSFCASLSFAAAFAPVPMTVTVQDQVIYAFDGSEVEISFDLVGKPGRAYLVINTKYADAQKPVAVQNGFKGWHYVNKIDTTVYVSSGYNFVAGNGLKFTWNGKGNERAPQNYTDGENVAPGTYNYYVWAYDNVSNRISACDFVGMGNYWEGMHMRFYNKDAQGNLLQKPVIMGAEPFFHLGKTPRVVAGTFLKWELGGDPSDASLLQTSQSLPVGFDTNKIGYGVSVFDPKDYSTFYFVQHDIEQKKSTPTKWTFVTDGQALQDMSWGTYENVEWFYPANKGSYSLKDVLVTDTDGEYIYRFSPGQNPMNYRWDKMMVIPWDTPESTVWDGYMDDFYMPENPTSAAQSNSPRTVGEVNGVIRGLGKNFLLGGELVCLTEMIDVSRITTNVDVTARGADGFVVWANSNGDYFMDKAWQQDFQPAWSCIINEPRTADTGARVMPGGVDMNGFSIHYHSYLGLNSFTVSTQDGSGIDYMKLGDDAVGDFKKKGYGSFCESGTIYDGLYMNNALSVANNNGGNEALVRGCNWIACDSDMGIITTNVIGVEGAAPAAFTVAQNSPNPFNPKTTLTYTLAKEGRVTVDVYNVAGQKVDTLVNDIQSAGSHSVVWDAANRAAGVYFYTVKSGNFSKTMKMTLLK